MEGTCKTLSTITAPYVEPYVTRPVKGMQAEFGDETLDTTVVQRGANTPVVPSIASQLLYFRLDLLKHLEQLRAQNPEAVLPALPTLAEVRGMTAEDRDELQRDILTWKPVQVFNMVDEPEHIRVVGDVPVLDLGQQERGLLPQMDELLAGFEQDSLAAEPQPSTVSSSPDADPEQYILQFQPQITPTSDALPPAEPVVA